ncbi:FUSC family protein [Mycobacterium sp. CVI_P3]|uniref:FUSC family protein n=1 Tax=Mycobacterium pinniadriaticum TaxID=2994102 RepID=A0ABT3SJ85_9MYCO|nr:FUSC family protein [Mycobacterium pinniadriaticum]MCX2932751.1 FUSC family protein [Mycobacterium pinniadriaticum]MCX2939189.1 FUSC family protein [Mycobacterium pinniadriaticum]
MATPARWPKGLRAAISTAIPATAGWALGAMSSGLIATLGSFTARFGGDRPYANRGIELATVAVSLAAAVALGDWAAQVPGLGVLTVSLVAVAAVWLCNALAVGPPGAYVFVVACAAGIGVSAAQLAPWTIGVLVLAGGAVAWLVQMAGALVSFRGPERAAVTAAADAVADYIAAADSPRERAARLRAATALHKSWSVLVNYQPLPASEASVLHRLRAANHAVHVLFTTAVTAVTRGAGPDPQTADQARRLASLQLAPETVATRDPERITLGAPALVTVLRRAVSPGSHVRHVMQRVAVGVPLAGAAAIALGVDHAYWAMAAAVLVLHQGADRSRTLRRGAERLLGTWVGLGLAAVILSLHPHDLWLVLLLALLNFIIELLVVRSYTLATVFITAAALTISSGTHAVDIGHVLWARGIDTLIGCAVGLAVYLVAARWQEAARLTDAIGRTLEATAGVFPYIAAGETAGLTARTARRDLQIAAIGLIEADEAALAGGQRTRATAEHLLPAVAATEKLAYRTIAACWAVEHRADGAEFGRSLFGGRSAQPDVRALHALAAAVRGGAVPPERGDPPPFVAHEITELRQSLAPD